MKPIKLFKIFGFMSLKGSKSIVIANAFQKYLDNSKCKPNKIWVDTASEFYNKSMKL